MVVIRMLHSSIPRRNFKALKESIWWWWRCHAIGHFRCQRLASHDMMMIGIVLLIIVVKVVAIWQLGKPVRGQRGHQEERILGKYWLLKQSNKNFRTADQFCRITWVGQATFLFVKNCYKRWRKSKQLDVSCNETSGVTAPNRNVCPH